jgi:hypothetical protein
MLASVGSHLCILPPGMIVDTRLDQLQIILKPSCSVSTSPARNTHGPPNESTDAQKLREGIQS